MILEEKVLTIIKLEMMYYNRIGELDLYLKHINMYGRMIEDRKLDIRDSMLGQIAVIGQSEVRQNHLLGIGKDLGFDEEQIEFV